MSLLAAHLLQSTVFALAVVLVLAASARNASPRLRYALLLTALAKFAIPPIVVPWPVPVAFQPLLPVLSREPAASFAASAAEKPFDWTPLLAAVWAAGAALSLALWLVRSRRFITSLAPLGPSGIPCHFPVFLSDTAPSPLAAGVFRRFIVLPSALPGRLSGDELRAVLLHESIHLRHHDNLVANLAMLLRSVYWFHPLVWWLDHQALVTRELARDEEVLSLVELRSYIAALLKVCQSGIGLPVTAPAAMQSHKLQKRIEFAMKSSTPQSPFARRAWVGVSLAVALAASVLVNSKPISAAQQPRSRKDGSVSVSRAMSPYDKWVGEDVAYIITFHELVRFDQIRTNAEREQFIEQFWLIRDPTPGTPENEMKEEHYRRIAYANERFSTSTKAGWQTMRGRFYITMGPPDEIESHPDRQIQMWRYHAMDGVTFTFDLKDPKQ